MFVDCEKQGGHVEKAFVWLFRWIEVTALRSAAFPLNWTDNLCRNMKEYGGHKLPTVRKIWN